MPDRTRRSKRPPARPPSEALMIDTAAVVMRIVRDQQTSQSVASAQVAWLVRKVLSCLAEKEAKCDTLLRIPKAKFVTWASQVRDGLGR